MDAFGIHRGLIADHGRYIPSFVDIRDPRVARTVGEAVARGLLWPDPWLQLNPSFEPGGSPDELVDQEVLHPECARVFRVKEDRGDFGPPLRFHFFLHRAQELVFSSFSLGADGVFHWSLDRRELLRAELDAAMFHIYGLDRDEVVQIMETFPIVKRKDEARHGEYRTRRLILEIYDDIAKYLDAGMPYQTRLDPPPADPSLRISPDAASGRQARPNTVDGKTS